MIGNWCWSTIKDHFVNLSIPYNRNQISYFLADRKPYPLCISAIEMETTQLTILSMGKQLKPIICMQMLFQKTAFQFYDGQFAFDQTQLWLFLSFLSPLLTLHSDLFICKILDFKLCQSSFKIKTKTWYAK